MIDIFRRGLWYSQSRCTDVCTGNHSFGFAEIRGIGSFVSTITPAEHDAKHSG